MTLQKHHGLSRSSSWRNGGLLGVGLLSTCRSNPPSSAAARPDANDRMSSARPLAMAKASTSPSSPPNLDAKDGREEEEEDKEEPLDNLPGVDKRRGKPSRSPPSPLLGSCALPPPPHEPARCSSPSLELGLRSPPSADKVALLPSAAWVQSYQRKTCAGGAVVAYYVFKKRREALTLLEDDHTLAVQARSARWDKESEPACSMLVMTQKLHLRKPKVSKQNLNENLHALRTRERDHKPASWP